MKIKISTTYFNVNEEFLENWLRETGSMVELHGVVDDLREFGHAVYKSKDPDSDAYGETEYMVVK